MRGTISLLRTTPLKIFIPSRYLLLATTVNTAEKAPKAYLIFKNTTFERTHDLVVLQGLCLDFEE